MKFIETDIRVDTYGDNGSNALVRLVHIPTNIGVECCTSRSRYENKQKAFKLLKEEVERYHDCLRVEKKVTHWMPLPSQPGVKND